MERPDLSAGDAVTFRQTLTADDLDISARLAADTNRVPIEEDVATGTRFQGRLVHSTVLSGPINATIARLPGLPIILRQKLEFLAPAQPGETVTTHCEIVEALGERRYRLRPCVSNEADDEYVAGEVIVLLDDHPETDGRDDP